MYFIGILQIEKKKTDTMGKKEKEKTSCQKKKKKIGQRWAQLFIFDLISSYKNYKCRSAIICNCSSIVFLFSLQ